MVQEWGALVQQPALGSAEDNLAAYRGILQTPEPFPMQALPCTPMRPSGCKQRTDAGSCSRPCWILVG